MNFSRQQQVFLSALALCLSPVESFMADAGRVGPATRLLATDVAATSTDDLLKPSYDIEPIPIRIGHGFDIHRMAPLEEAGQPVVIGGVEIPHKDQKVCLALIPTDFPGKGHPFHFLLQTMLIHSHSQLFIALLGFVPAEFCIS